MTEERTLESTQGSTQMAPWGGGSSTNGAGKGAKDCDLPPRTRVTSGRGEDPPGSPEAINDTGGDGGAEPRDLGFGG